MATKFYVDGAGRYIGGVDGGPAPPNSTEVPAPPPHGDFYTWDGTQWVEDTDRADREADDGIRQAFEADKVRRLLFELNFDQEERLRVLESKPVITKAQYRDALITKWKALP